MIFETSTKICSNQDLFSEINKDGGDGDSGGIIGNSYGFHEVKSMLIEDYTVGIRDLLERILKVISGTCFNKIFVNIT